MTVYIGIIVIAILLLELLSFLASCICIYFISAITYLMGACFDSANYANSNNGKRIADNKVHNLPNAVVGGTTFFSLVDILIR